MSSCCGISAAGRRRAVRDSKTYLLQRTESSRNCAHDKHSKDSRMDEPRPRRGGPGNSRRSFAIFDAHLVTPKSLRSCSIPNIREWQNVCSPLKRRPICAVITNRDGGHANCNRRLVHGIVHCALQTGRMFLKEAFGNAHNIAGIDFYLPGDSHGGLGVLANAPDVNV